MAQSKIINLHSDEDDSKLEEYIKVVRDENAKFVSLAINPTENTISLYSTASHPADLIILSHHLTRLIDYMVETYGFAILDDNDDD